MYQRIDILSPMNNSFLSYQTNRQIAIKIPNLLDWLWRCCENNQRGEWAGILPTYQARDWDQIYRNVFPVI